MWLGYTVVYVGIVSIVVLDTFKISRLLRYVFTFYSDNLKIISWKS